ncbi:uncharacterized protein LOC123205105 [Mangifera indica]|uniref:uncharacterized protein LOC123205105 n=1 Tax=Mangifera indica TaxID=29780 RepID=UPI001CF98A56|nr:uncharacterized protein LOC123205105 [Mangifera indica]
MVDDDDEEDAPQKNTNIDEPKLIGLHPVSNEKVLLKKGPYGFYVQLGEARRPLLPILRMWTLLHLKTRWSCCVTFNIRKPSKGWTSSYIKAYKGWIFCLTSTHYSFCSKEYGSEGHHSREGIGTFAE